jgi:hypothetical protein
MWCSLLLSPPAALAHDVGCDGKPPTAEIKSSCCGDHDWLRLQPGMWRQDGNVYFVMIDGQWNPVVKYDGSPMEPLPSTDGCDYVWFRRQSVDGRFHDDETAHVGVGHIAFYCLQLAMAF